MQRGRRSFCLPLRSDRVWVSPKLPRHCWREKSGCDVNQKTYVTPETKVRKNVQFVTFSTHIHIYWLQNYLLTQRLLNNSVVILMLWRIGACSKTLLSAMFEFLIAVLINIQLFWSINPCRLVKSYWLLHRSYWLRKVCRYLPVDTTSYSNRL